MSFVSPDESCQRAKLLLLSLPTNTIPLVYFGALHITDKVTSVVSVELTASSKKTHIYSRMLYDDREVYHLSKDTFPAYSARNILKVIETCVNKYKTS